MDQHDRVHPVLDALHAALERQGNILAALQKKLETHTRLIQSRTHTLVSHQLPLQAAAAQAQAVPLLAALPQDARIEAPVMDVDHHPRTASPSKRLPSAMTATVAAPVLPSEAIPVPMPSAVEAIAADGVDADTMVSQQRRSATRRFQGALNLQPDSSTPGRFSTGGALSSARLKARSSTRVQSIVSDVMQKLKKSAAASQGLQLKSSTGATTDVNDRGAAGTATAEQSRHHPRPVRRVNHGGVGTQSSTTTTRLNPRTLPMEGNVKNSSWDVTTRLQEIEAIKASNHLALERTHSTSHGLFSRTASTLRGRHHTDPSASSGAAAMLAATSPAVSSELYDEPIAKGGNQDASTLRARGSTGRLPNAVPSAKSNHRGANFLRQSTAPTPAMSSSASSDRRVVAPIAARIASTGSASNKRDRATPVSALPTAPSRKSITKPITASRLSGKTPRKFIERLVLIQQGQSQRTAPPSASECPRPPPPHRLPQRATRAVHNTTITDSGPEHNRSLNEGSGTIASIPQSRAKKVSRPPWSSTTKLPPTRDPVPLARFAGTSAV